MTPKQRGSRSHDFDSLMQAVARDDASMQVPGHVEAAVMAAWDASRSRAPLTHAPDQRRRWPLLRIGMLAGSAVAIAFVLVIRAVLHPESAISGVNSAPPQSIAAPVQSTEQLLPTSEAAEMFTEDRPLRPHRPRAAARTAAYTEANVDGAGLLLASDPVVDPTSAMIVRMRIPADSLIALGIPVAAAELSGNVTVAVLLGEDGVARSIRRVTDMSKYRKRGR